MSRRSCAGASRSAVGIRAGVADAARVACGCTPFSASHVTEKGASFSRRRKVSSESKEPVPAGLVFEGVRSGAPLNRDLDGRRLTPRHSKLSPAVLNNAVLTSELLITAGRKAQGSHQGMSPSSTLTASRFPTRSAISGIECSAYTAPLCSCMGVKSCAMSCVTTFLCGERRSGEFS